jgi:hypothetical protein
VKAFGSTLAPHAHTIVRTFLRIISRRPHVGQASVRSSSLIASPSRRRRSVEEAIEVRGSIPQPLVNVIHLRTQLASFGEEGVDPARQSQRLGGAVLPCLRYGLGLVVRHHHPPRIGE